MTFVEDVNNRKNLVDVAMGRKPAHLLLRNGRWVNVQSGEIISRTDIAIYEDRIAYVGQDASHTIGEFTEIIDVKDRFLVPGLLDAHMHVESGMLTVTEFVRAIIPHGTTGIFIDPHEIANIFGLKGVRLMVEEAIHQPIHVWVQVPSCVPSAPGLETPGASIDAQEVAEALGWRGIIGLGEVMNFPGVYMNDDKMHAEISEALKVGKVIGGHYASPDLGLPFHGYVAGGVEDDHEGTRSEDVIARVRQGMKAILRQGSGWQDVAAQVKAIVDQGLDSRHILLCTDDSHSETLVNEGHVNRAVKVAIATGVSPIKAIQMATINTAEHFGLAREIGMIAPGRFADILIVSDLEQLQIDKVFGKGKLLAENGKVVIDINPYPYPAWVKNSVHLAKPLIEVDFLIKSPPENQPSNQGILTNVIGIIENQAPTRHLRLHLPVEAGVIKPEIQENIAKIALVERHQATGRIQLGFVQGFGFNVPCAVASTVAHDCHHMLIVGTSEADMATAGNRLAKMGGGQVVIKDGELIGMVDLPIAGLMSDECAPIVAQKAQSILEGFRSCGCQINNPNMQLSLLALVVIPELRISDLGLVDVNQFRMTSLFES
jgi:adenine deaminase